MATPARGSAAVPTSLKDVSYQDWDAQTRFNDMRRTSVELNAGRVFNVSGAIASLSPDIKSGVGPDPGLRYGLPGNAKGAILALDPDDHTTGDALYFSRYPTELTERIEAVLASDTTPGRAYPAFQQMGAKGVQLSTELWFCDAFLWSRRATFSSVIYSGGPEYHDAVIDNRQGKALGTLADQARTFFEFYIAGHDGTGIALPPADMFLLWGGRDVPIPIVIKSVEMKMEHFTTKNDMRPQLGGVPQMVTAKVDFEVNIPLRTFSPYQPKKPKPPGGKKIKTKTCATGPGWLPDFSEVVISATNSPWETDALVPENDAKIRASMRLAPKGFSPP